VFTPEVDFQSGEYAMGEVIAFQSPASSRPAQPRSAGEEAQILFFTGVRYVPAIETASEPVAPSHDGTPRGKRRRREP
jgi:hypothetical protein